jgi:hypothetical protein
MSAYEVAGQRGFIENQQRAPIEIDAPRLKWVLFLHAWIAVMWLKKKGERA